MGRSSMTPAWNLLPELKQILCFLWHPSFDSLNGKIIVQFRRFLVNS